MSECKLLSDYAFYRNTIEKLLILIGVRTYEKPGFIVRSLPYIQTTLSFLMCLGILGYVQAHNDIPSITKGVSIMISFVTMIIKMTCLIIHRKEILELHQILDPYFDELLKKSDTIRIVLGQLSFVHRLTWIFLFFVTFSCSAWIVIPLYSFTSQYLHHVHPIHYSLIFPAVYPWNVPFNGLIFRLHFIFESFALVSLCTITISVNTLFPFYVFLMVGQLREFNHNISNIDEKSDSNIMIKKCVDQYCTIIKCRDNLQKAFGPIVLWIMCTNAVVLCMLIFQITNMKTISKVRAFLIATYTSLKLMQAFMYAWAGTCLTTESENCGDAVYSSNWHGNKRFMTSVTIMLTQKPIIMTACSFTTVSLDIFVMVINTTISYFFLLRTLEQA